MKIEYIASVGKNPDFLISTVVISQNCFIKRNHYLIFSSDRIFSIGQTTKKFHHVVGKNTSSQIILICRTTRIFFIRSNSFQ